MSSQPFSVLASLLLASTAVAQIIPGNLVVVRSGDGSASLTSTSTLMFVDQYDRAIPGQVTPLSTLSMPITISGSATSEGFVTQSVDGNYLVTVGYNTAPGTLTVANTAATLVNRVVARIDLNGVVDATTALSDTYSGSSGTAGNIRSANTVDGTSFWTSGTGLAAANRGVCWTTLGAATATQLSSTPTNCRVANLANGQVYVSTASSPFVGVSAVGAGLPTTTGQTTTLLTGFPSAGTPSQYDFWFADAQTLYVADDRNSVSGGIQKWTESAGTWTLQYTLNPALNIGCRGLSGIRDLSGTTLYATTTQASANTLVSVLDTGAGSAFTTLATAPANTAFRGVRFVRTPYGVTFGGTGCTTSAGIPTIGTAGGAPVSGNGSFGLALGNTPPFSLYITVVSIGLPINPLGLPLGGFGAPPCSFLFTLSLDILLAGVTDPTGAAVTPLGLPTPDASLWGLTLGTQHLVFDGAFYPGFGLPVGDTTGMQIVIGN
jgi:hypothetical protein